MNATSRDRVKGYLKAVNKKTVNGDGNEVILKGWGAGNWNNPEGFMVGALAGFDSSTQKYKPAIRM